MQTAVCQGPPVGRAGAMSGAIATSALLANKQWHTAVDRLARGTQNQRCILPRAARLGQSAGLPEQPVSRACPPPQPKARRDGGRESFRPTDSPSGSRDGRKDSRPPWPAARPSALGRELTLRCWSDLPLRTRRQSRSRGTLGGRRDGVGSLFGRGVVHVVAAMAEKTPDPLLTSHSSRAAALATGRRRKKVDKRLARGHNMG